MKTHEFDLKIIDLNYCNNKVGFFLLPFVFQALTFLCFPASLCNHKGEI